MNFKVFIPTAGIGSRLGKFSKNLNKSLLSVNNKPIIAHIIDLFPNNTRFVIALGFKGDLVRQFLKNAYPKKNFEYVVVKNYKGVGSSLSLTLNKSKKYLQSPFIFFACDTIVDKKPPDPKYNWLGYSKKKIISKDFRSLKIQNSTITKINEKVVNNKKIFPYIGVAGIKDYKKFWLYHSKYGLKNGEVSPINKMLVRNKFRKIKFNWYDFGTKKNYISNKVKLEKKNNFNILEKEHEAIYFVNKKVVKYSSDKDFISKRVQRAKILRGFVPKITLKTSNFFSYKFLPGEVISSNLNLKIFKTLLKHLEKFWVRKRTKNSESSLLKFYKNKTQKRILSYLKKKSLTDRSYYINFIKVPKIGEMLRNVDWNMLSKGNMGRFHGDLHFENIIFNKRKKMFSFLDWRQDFEGNLKNGDIYYDFGKLLHGMLVSHKEVIKNNFNYVKNKKFIQISIKRDRNLQICKQHFFKWLKHHNYSIYKVELISSLIFLNIATLHHTKYDDFLFNFGKLQLFKTLKKHKYE